MYLLGNNKYSRCIVSKTINISDVLSINNEYIDVLSLNNEYERGIVSETINIIDVLSLNNEYIRFIVYK